MGDPAFCTRGRYSVLPITGAGQAVRRFAYGAPAALLRARGLSAGDVCQESWMIRIGVDVGGTFTDIVLEQSGHGGDSRVVVNEDRQTVKS